MDTTLQNCGLGYIPMSLIKENVSLAFNDIRNIPDDIKHVSENIIFFDLHDNKVTCVSDKINTMTRAKYIDLSNNQISQIPSIHNLHNLVYLSLKNNKITHLADSAF